MERVDIKIQKTHEFTIFTQTTFVKRTFSESQRIKYETLLKYMTHINVRMKCEFVMGNVIIRDLDYEKSWWPQIFSNI